MPVERRIDRKPVRDAVSEATEKEVTEMGNSESERRHSTEERGEPKPTGPQGGKAVRQVDGSVGRQDERDIELGQRLNENPTGSKAVQASTEYGAKDTGTPHRR